MKQLNIPFEEQLESFESADNFDKFRVFSPSGTVPCLIDHELNDRVVWDSLGITEHLAESHEQVWPTDGEARSFARCAVSEMHSSFGQLRNICPMNCAIKVEMFEITAGLQRDLNRLDSLFAEGLDRFGGPYLAGHEFTAADAFFCPVAYRVASYQLPLAATSREYLDRLLALPAMRQWDEAAIKESWREEAHEEEAAAAGRIIHDRRIS